MREAEGRGHEVSGMCEKGGGDDGDDMSVGRHKSMPRQSSCFGYRPKSACFMGATLTGVVEDR